MLFVLSLGYFAYSYVVRFGRPATGSDSWRAVAWNIGLFALFALHHSVFARDGVRRRIASVVPAGCERPVFVWTASLLLAVVCAWWQPVAGMVWETHGPARWLLGTAQASGALLALGSAIIIGVWELAGISPTSSAAVENTATESAPMKAVGPYRWVRHPIYTGWFLMVFAAPSMAMTKFVFAIVSAVYTLVGIVFEERSLRATSGQAYDRYARQVRWKLFPGLY